MPQAMAEVRSCMERPFDEVLKSLKGKYLRIISSVRESAFGKQKKLDIWI